jgi:rare lipoprotein A
MPCAAPLQRTRWPQAGRGLCIGVVALALAACASKPPESARSTRPQPAPAAAPTAVPPAPNAPVASAGDRDGPEARPPADLERVPDAEPKLETLRPGGPNKPYEVAGQAYVPLVKDDRFTERGLASWYGRKFHGRRTASGEVYNMYAMTAAHKTLPIPSYARVRNPANGKEVLVRVNDRGPFVKGRIIDLSYTAALKLGVLRGVAPVELERITFDDIRTGAWRREAGEGTAVAMAAPAVTAPPASDTEPAVPAVLSAVPPTEAPLGTAEPPIATAAAAPAYTAPARGFWVQLGAFRERGGAEDFQRRVMTELDWLTPLLAVFIDLPLFRLQAGPYPNRDEARGAAEQIRTALRLVPVIVERR